MPSKEPLQVANLIISPPSVGHNGYVGFNPHKETPPKGWNGFNSRALSDDLIVEHDVGIKVRDGCTLYCDIFRPPNSDHGEKVPDLVCWSPFGKKHNGIGMMKKIPWGVGVPKGCLSGLERFEGVDPAEYCPRDFTVVNVDARGAGDSEGDIDIMGTQEGEDGHDVIEALARMDWCNGNIGLAGNSHLGIVQWFIAATKSPSFRAIAPWEAAGDLYREQFVRGGTWDNGLFDLITKQVIRGRRGLEDFREMYRRCQVTNGYWRDKRAVMEEIEIPTYVVASYSTFVHTMGSVVEESREELARFFGHYLKGEKGNGWDKTPKVRMSVLKFGNTEPIYPIGEEDYPIPRTDYRELFFCADAQSTFVGFTHTFDSKTRLVGLPKAVVHVSCKDLDDMVVYVLIRKLNKDGNPLLNLTIPWSAAPYNKMADIPVGELSNLLLYFGPLGILRASRREIDHSMSIHPHYPFHTHSNVQKIPPGDIVELEIGIWAMGIEFEAGESLRVQISGQYPLIPEYKQAKPAPVEEKNKVRHNVHFGGRYPSRIILPFV